MSNPESFLEIQIGEGLGLVALVKRAFARANNEGSEIDPQLLKLHGMSGRLYRHFINNLIRECESPHYLEVGSWSGSTLCAAISNNAVWATAIDNWSQFGGPKTEFELNVARFRTPQAYTNFIESDFRAVDYKLIGPFDIYLFDGPHEYQDQYDGLALALPALADQFVFIVDDWNFEDVRSGTKKAIADIGLEVEYSIEIRSSLDGTHPTIAHENSDWHNGYFISVLRKSRS